jgi:hypothetical protein
MEESRTTAAQTLDVVHGLVNNMEVVMEGGRFSSLTESHGTKRG